MILLRPRLVTSRLEIRAFKAEDFKSFYEAINHSKIAADMGSLSYPYPEAEAIKWFESHDQMESSGRALVMAITLQGYIIGAVSLVGISMFHSRCALTYWVSPEHWGKGYCTEAVEAVIKFATQDLSIHRVFAQCFERNFSSRKVLEKVGMTFDGLFIDDYKKDGVYENIVQMSMVGSSA